MHTPKRAGKSKSQLAALQATNRFCGAKTNEGNECIHLRGWNTNHPGEGRCYQHDTMINGSPVVGYRIPAIAERMEDFQRDEDIYSLDKEIGLCRAYLELYYKHLEVFKNLSTSELQELGISFTPSDLNNAINQTVRTISTLIKTKSEIEIARKFVIDLRVVELMFMKVASILESEIEDTDLKNKISLKLGTIMLNS